MSIFKTRNQCFKHRNVLFTQSGYRPSSPYTILWVSHKVGIGRVHRTPSCGYHTKWVSAEFTVHHLVGITQSGYRPSSPYTILWVSHKVGIGRVHRTPSCGYHTKWVSAEFTVHHLVGITQSGYRPSSPYTILWVSHKVGIGRVHRTPSCLVFLQKERKREGGERENSKTLFYKDCSLGSVKNLTTSPTDEYISNYRHYVYTYRHE